MSDSPESRDDAPEIGDSPQEELAIPSELIEDIPEEQRDKVIQYVKQSLRVERFSGPLPPPSVLALYEPEVQKTIVNESVENRIHRTSVEKRGQTMFFVREIAGLLFGFILALVVIVGSIQSIQSGYNVEGLVGIVGAVSLVVGAFLYTDHKKRSDRKELQKLQDQSNSLDAPDSVIESGPQISIVSEGNDE